MIVNDVRKGKKSLQMVGVSHFCYLTAPLSFHSRGNCGKVHRVSPDNGFIHQDTFFTGLELLWPPFQTGYFWEQKATFVWIKWDHFGI